MDDLGEKLQTLLSDPESMRNLSELAAMLRQPEGDVPPSEIPPAQSAAQSSVQPDLTKLMALGQMLSQGGSDDTENLILALKPHLSAERAARAAKAVKLLHLWHMVNVLRESGMLGELF